MAVEEVLQKISAEAGSDLSSYQYRAMKLNSSSQMALPSAGGDIDGVLQDKPDAAGRAGALAFGGRTKWEAGGTITAGADVTTDGNGKCVAATTTGHKVHGRALEAATSGAIIAVLLTISKEPVA